MIRKVLIVAMMAAAFSCGSKDEKIPANVLSQDKMRDILIDIHILEGVVNTSGHQADTANAEFKLMKENLFTKHGVKQMQFDSSMAYYTQHLNLMDAIYTQVIDSISIREAKLKVD